MHVVHLNCLHFIHTEHHDYVCNDGPDCNYLQVTFYSRQSIATVNITIINDTEVECNETVIVHIDHDDRFELTNEVTITIVDDDIGKSLTLYAFYYNKMIIYMHKPP